MTQVTTQTMQTMQTTKTQEQPVGQNGQPRFDACFAQCRAEQRAALVCYLTAGIPDLEQSVELLQSLPTAGADIIEIGMPFSDPMADGPTIQRASTTAIAHGATTAFALQCAQKLRAAHPHTPIVLMGYFNPVYRYGCAQFAHDAALAGVDGVIVVDLPPEVDDELRLPLQEHGVCLIRLATPTTDEARLAVIANGASGFLYYVSITGITGTAAAATDAVVQRLQHLRTQLQRVAQAGTEPLPVAVGFGVRTAEDVHHLAPYADAVVVGSKIIAVIEEHMATPNLSADARATACRAAVMDEVAALRAGCTHQQPATAQERAQ